MSPTTTHTWRDEHLDAAHAHEVSFSVLGDPRVIASEQRSFLSSALVDTAGGEGSP